jgi:hypothetical protein
MNIQMFAIYDSKATAYLPPFNLPTIQMAKRTFTDTVNDLKHSFSQHPEDYTLFHIGEFDDEKGILQLTKIHDSICNGKEVQDPDYDYPTEADKIFHLEQGMKDLFDQMQAIKEKTK